MSKESQGQLFTDHFKRIVRSVSTPGEGEEVIQKRLKALDMTFQEYCASLIAYDCWAEKPHLLTGEACKGHRRGRESKSQEKLLWKEIVRDFGKEKKTGSFFAHRVAEVVAKIIDPDTKL